MDRFTPCTTDKLAELLRGILKILVLVQVKVEAALLSKHRTGNICGAAHVQRQPLPLTTSIITLSMTGRRLHYHYDV